MLAYVMVGTSDMKKALKFYDATLAPLGLSRAGGGKNYTGYGPKGDAAKARFFVTKPYDKKSASAGNGTMITFQAKSRKAVEAFHAAAVAAGGKDEGKPGPRPAGAANSFAYVRDLDGNKICACCFR